MVHELDQEAIDLFDKGMDLYEQGEYYDSMTTFTSCYNLSGNTIALFHSAVATFEVAKGYYNQKHQDGWDTFSKNAVHKLDVVIRYSTDEEVIQKAREYLANYERIMAEVNSL